MNARLALSTMSCRRLPVFDSIAALLVTYRMLTVVFLRSGSLSLSV